MANRPPSLAAALKALPWMEPPWVMVVDDHPVNLNLAGSMLAGLGCRVETAVDGPSAVSARRSRRFDLVFMDCQMPEMDGFEVTRRLRELDDGARMPIVAHTAVSVPGFREKCLASGMDDYHTKPCTAAEFAAILRKWIPSKLAAPGESVPASAAAQPEPGAEGPMDWSRLAQMDDGTEAAKAGVRKLLQLFLDTTRAGLDRARAAVEGGGRQDLAKVLHKLKGGCGTMGAVALARAADAMEESLARGREADLRAQLETLETEFARTREALEARG